MKIWTHAELCRVAERWLRNRMGCGATISELSSYAGEQPDAMGWKWAESYLIEVKVSRADFLADKKKRWRSDDLPSLGCVRYYMAPRGMIEIEELPQRWGLLEVHGRRPIVKVAHGVRPAQIPPPEFRCEDRSLMGEMILLCSALRRAQEAVA